MRRRLLATLTLAVLAAVFASAAASPPPGFAVPSGSGWRAEEPLPLLGTAWNDAARSIDLVHVDPASLRALPEPSLRVGIYGAAWAYSPTRERLAVATHAAARRGIAASLQIVDPSTLRRVLALPLGYSRTVALAWLEPDRILVLRLAFHPERLEVLVVAPSAKRIIARARLDGELHAVEETADALVVLLAPAGRIGPGRLVVVSASGAVRSVGLERVWIGFERSDSDAGDHVGTQRGAGFTVDPVGRRAFVFPAGSDAAAIDLRRLAVTYHALREPVSVFGRLRRFLDPAATAKVVDGPSRTARWLGDGLVAVTGADYATWKDRESRFQTRTTPAGLTVVDTETWRVRTLDPGASWFVRSGGVLLATGGTTDSSTRVTTSMGLAAYTADGSRRFRVFAGEPVVVHEAFRGLAYVRTNDAPFQIVEVASGRIVGTRRDPPPLLLVDP